MRTGMIVGALALTGASVAFGQSVMTPKTVQMMPVSQAQVAQLKQQIDALTAKVAAQDNMIAGLKIQAQKTAIGGFANKGDLANLEKRVIAGEQQNRRLEVVQQNLQTAQASMAAGVKLLANQFGGHVHRNQDMVESPDGKKHARTLKTTAPDLFCVSKGEQGTPYVKDWKCTNPYP